MKKILVVLFLFAGVNCFAQTPAKADIEKAMRGKWDRAQTSSSPKQSITIASIKIGSGAIANVQDKIDGIPPKAKVTIAQIDFTVREYYNDKTAVTRRVMNAKVFKDQFDDWVVMSNGMKSTESSFESKQ